MTKLFSVVESIEWTGGKDGSIEFKVRKIEGYSTCEVILSNGMSYDYKFAQDGKAYFHSEASYKAGKRPCTLISEEIQSLLNAYTGAIDKDARLVRIETDKYLDMKARKRADLGKVFSICGKGYAYFYGSF